MIRHTDEEWSEWMVQRKVAAKIFTRNAFRRSRTIDRKNAKPFETDGSTVCTHPSLRFSPPVGKGNLMCEKCK